MSIIIKIFFMISFIALNGCSGGSSDDKNTGTIKTGKFFNVSGLDYTTSSKLTGTLQEDSLFQYKEGDTIKFYKDDIVLGEIMAEKSITVYSFDNEITVIQALTAMDIDRESNNGYQIQ